MESISSSCSDTDLSEGHESPPPEGFLTGLHVPRAGALLRRISVGLGMTSAAEYKEDEYDDEEQERLRKEVRRNQRKERALLRENELSTSSFLVNLRRKVYRNTLVVRPLSVEVKSYKQGLYYRVFPENGCLVIEYDPMYIWMNLDNIGADLLGDVERDWGDTKDLEDRDSQFSSGSDFDSDLFSTDDSSVGSSDSLGMNDGAAGHVEGTEKAEISTFSTFRAHTDGGAGKNASDAHESQGLSTSASAWPEKSRDSISVATGATATNSQTTTSVEFTDTENMTFGASDRWSECEVGGLATDPNETAEWNGEDENSLDEFPKGYL